MRRYIKHRGDSNSRYYSEQKVSHQNTHIIFNREVET